MCAGNHSAYHGAECTYRDYDWYREKDNKEESVSSVVGSGPVRYFPGNLITREATVSIVTALISAYLAGPSKIKWLESRAERLVGKCSTYTRYMPLWFKN